jgi:hypothetical protein
VPNGFVPGVRMTFPVSTHPGPVPSVGVPPFGAPVSGRGVTYRYDGGCATRLAPLPLTQVVEIR